MSMVGRTYLERGAPVEVLAQWRGAHLPPVELTDGIEVAWVDGLAPKWIGRNVLIRRADGELVVRPSRGLRKP